MTLGLDSWDSASPTDTLMKLGYFDPKGMLANVRFVLKIQWQPLPLWDELFAKTGIPVTPWTIFPSREFPLEAFQYDPTAKHIYTGAINGVMRYGRTDYRNMAQKHQDFYVSIGSKDDTMDEYLNILRACRWGISLCGKRGTDGKNRREIEYVSCGMPLALNYCPHYPFPFFPERDFILLKSPDDLLRLRDTDPAPFAEASRQVYRDHWSPVGMSRTLIQLVDQYCPLLARR